MIDLDTISLYALLAAIGGLLGSAATVITQRIKLTHFKQMAQQIIQKAEQESEVLINREKNALKQHQIEQQRQFELERQSEHKKTQIAEERLKQREEKQASRLHLIEKKLLELDKRETDLLNRKMDLEQQEKKSAHLQNELLVRLEQCSGLSSKEAKQQILNHAESEVRTDAAHLIRRTLKEAQEHAEQEASRVIATAINRLAVACVSETTVHTVSIPNEEMKGRIIGREGKNIRAFEKCTGVNIVIDDTPDAVVLSGFDPTRMQIAKTALAELVHDGRIHPTRIEEAVDKAKHQVQKMIKTYGEDAALRAGVITLHPELINLLGKLKFRYSYGQNILEHSLEVAHLMGLMSAELGLDMQLAKRIGLLHDVGKAVSHEVEGSHAVVGHDLALKYGETAKVANGIGCHHKEMEAMTIEGSLCSAADAISASRCGARIESVESYVKRLKKLEELACEFKGVEKAYALQAGREVRVVVFPDQVMDDGLVELARSLTKKIEQELAYPGKIKVTLVREKRVTEYAM
jgi:ribonucrease Y